mmetsp:Transcript_17372/g.29461  ORF Transcript_17372/g.29461 Transcript_17372/m.29461 type:complete len:96 (+) Transcript_17372:664-951(+)
MHESSHDSVFENLSLSPSHSLNKLSFLIRSTVPWPRTTNNRQPSRARRRKIVVAQHLFTRLNVSLCDMTTHPRKPIIPVQHWVEKSVFQNSSVLT